MAHFTLVLSQSVAPAVQSPAVTTQVGRFDRTEAHAGVKLTVSVVAMGVDQPAGDEVRSTKTSACSFVWSIDIVLVAGHTS